MSQPTTINGINIQTAAAYYQKNAASLIDNGGHWASAEVWYRALAGMAQQVVNRAEGVR